MGTDSKLGQRRITMEPKLSVLIATQGRREEKFLTLMKILSPQLTKARGKVEVVAYWNNGEEPIGVLRQRLIDEAKGEYVCFVDDDDIVPDYYCEEILKHLGKDYVGFQCAVFEDGQPRPISYHSIAHTTWSQDSNGYYRGITHLNPIRRSIALHGYFGDMRYAGEDYVWATSVAPLVKDENVIDKVMYYYYHDRKDTSFGGSFEIETDFGRPTIRNKYFRWHPLSKEKKIWNESLSKNQS